MASSSSLASFHDVLQRYASAHCQSGTDKTTSHSYGELYADLFAPMRESARRVLEIGVYSGASVAALADYFERAEVHGVDITLDNVRFGRENPRVHYHLGDGTQPHVASQVALAQPTDAKFDLILDDGSHRLGDQLAVLKAWGPHLLAPSADAGPDGGGGLLVIEDIAVPSASNSSSEIRAVFEAHARSAGLELVAWHDRRWIKNQFDDVVAIFKSKSA